ncbi:MAG TPA: molybdate ABC transporter substrate-binding protein [Micropepsaceae bacterium]|nr:molybdate ABC transporter substrate-binding protein [Micropepsaceae bacterium]
MVWVRWLIRPVFVALLLLVPVAAQAQAPGSITVLAAASLTDVMQEIGRNYQATTGKKVVFSFAGSMILAKQIEASAGADLFISADTVSMDYLEGKNLIAKGTRTNLLGNRLVLIAPGDSKIALRIESGFRLADALKGGRLAVANTDTVPAGRYGKAALTALGVWDGVKDRLAQGEDVRATLAYVARGEAPLGIVYATDARAEPKVRVVGTFPESSHQPIRYPAALTRDAKPDAAAFLAYLKTTAARAVLERAGFTVLAK